MRGKLALLLFMCGVLSAPLTFSAVGGGMSAVPIAAGAFLLGYAYLLFVRDGSDIFPGISFEGRAQSVIRRSAGALGLLFGGYCACFTFFCVTLLVFSDNTVKGISILLLFVFCALSGWLLGRLTVMKHFSKGRVDKALSAHPLFKEIHEKISLASCFIVGREWIALYDDRYCFAVYLYKEHRLCNVLTQEQFGILSGHFARKYEIEFYPEKEIKMICGKPGHSYAPAGDSGSRPSECCVFMRK